MDKKNNEILANRQKWAADLVPKSILPQRACKCEGLTINCLKMPQGT